MTEKAKRILALMNDRKHRQRLTHEMNQSTMDAAAPLGNGEVTILKDMEALDKEHDQHMKGLKGEPRQE